MKSSRTGLLSVALIFVIAPLASLWAAGGSGGLWTNPTDLSLPVDFKIQGEYVGRIDGGDKLGAQIIALGQSAFQAVLYPGGLPGAGWDGENKILLDGRMRDGKLATFTPAEGPRQYIEKDPARFSATRQFPPTGQKPYTAVANGTVMEGETDDGKTFRLEKTLRESPTAGKPAPKGAIVLFDGTNKDEWNGGRLDADTGLLNTDGQDMRTVRKFQNYTMHVEFMLPFRPDARSQGRGNSGFYQVDHYEVQILDSFGLDGVDNECGGIYKKAHPVVNMCFPPLTWQTYDVDFRNAVRDENGQKVKDAVITVRHNGVLIYENQSISGPTGGHRSDPEGTPGPIKLQGHGNPLQYRNLWIVEKD